MSQKVKSREHSQADRQTVCDRITSSCRLAVTKEVVPVGWCVQAAVQGRVPPSLPLHHKRTPSGCHSLTPAGGQQGEGAARGGGQTEQVKGHQKGAQQVEGQQKGQQWGVQQGRRGRGSRKGRSKWKGSRRGSRAAAGGGGQQQDKDRKVASRRGSTSAAAHSRNIKLSVRRHKQRCSHKDTQPCAQSLPLQPHSSCVRFACLHHPIITPG
jgi:hypothetical protein